MTDTTIIWGDPIPTPNGRPSWLLDAETVVDLQTRLGWRCSDGGAGNSPTAWQWSVITAIRLPADHAYYLATSKGFTYWPGGENAPADWDGSEVLMTGGGTLECSWDDQPSWKHEFTHANVIGYRVTAAPGDGYGLPIVVNGVIPDWLRDTDVGLFENYADRWLGEDGQTLMSWDWDRRGPCPLRIRLPHDHPYYTAIDRGFIYWPGGDTAPADWDGDAVLCRDGNLSLRRRSCSHWGKVEGWQGAEIIGYRRAVDDTVQVKRMTESEALELWGDLTTSMDSFERDFVTGLKRLGLIKPEPTRLERFHASTDNPTIEAALEFER